MRKRLLWLLPLLALLAAGGLWGWRAYSRADAASTPIRYDYDTPQRRDLRQTIVLHGTIVPILSTEIRSETSGRIERILVQPGDEVRAGQPLIELDQTALQAQLDEARLSVTGSELHLRRTTAEFTRLRTLAAQNFVTEKERLDAEITLQIAENTVAAQQARVRLLENTLTKSVLTAPYAGRVLNLAARPGMVVTGADSGREGPILLELADLSHLRVEANVNEIDVATLALGQEVEIAFESVPEAAATGRLTFISPAAGRTTNAAAGGRDYPVHIAVERSHPRIRPGMTARVRIITATATQALSIPHTHVFADLKTAEWFVFTRPTPDAPAETPPTKTAVTLGVRDQFHVEIRTGLDETSQVSRRRPPAVKFTHEQ